MNTEHCQELSKALGKLGYYRAGSITTGGVVEKEFFFNQDTVQITVDYTFLDAKSRPRKE